MTMPDDPRYRRLLEELARVGKSFDAAGDDAARLEAMIASQRALVLYIAQNAGTEDMLRPLGAIESALHDLRQGANVMLMEHHPRGSKPGCTTLERVQAALAWSVELLTGPGKMGSALAARVVAETARRHKLTDANGSPVTVKQIVSWRKELRADRAPSWACEHWVAFRKEYQPLLRMPPSDLKVARARQAAEQLVRVVAQLSPRSAPKAKMPTG
jgi:hypothetical protein